MTTDRWLSRSLICAISRHRPATALAQHLPERNPSHLARHLLLAVLAYRIQADVLGELDPATVRLLDSVGSTVPQIATITGHSLKEAILDTHYLGRDVQLAEMAESAIKKLNAVYG